MSALTMLRRVKAMSLALLAACVALVLPGLSRADEPPSTAVAACKAEYMQLGAAGFIAKYGAGETFGACLAAHGGSTTRPSLSVPKTFGFARSIS